MDLFIYKSLLKNVVENKICNVLTPISMDHMGFLGNSLRSITNEKIGILKNSTQTVISPQKSIVNKIIENFAIQKKIKLFSYKKTWEITKIDEKRQKFFYRFSDEINEYSIPKLFGKHQIFNSALALTVFKTICKDKINHSIVNKALKKTKWPARMQNLKNGNLSSYMGKNFEIWLDGGHNLEASNIIKNIIKKWKKENVFLVIGMMIGKDPYSFIKKLIKNLSAIFLLPIPDHQYIRPYEIKNNIKKDISSKISIECSVDIKEVLKIIKENYPSGKLVICGSLYLAGEVLKQDGFKIN